METKICSLSDITTLLADEGVIIPETPVYENSNFRRFRVCTEGAEGAQPLIYIKNVELAYPVRPAYGKCDPHTCRDIPIVTTEEMERFGDALGCWAALTCGGSIHLPTKDCYTKFTLRRRGDRELLTRVFDSATGEDVAVRFNPAKMTELFDTRGQPIQLIFFRIEVIETREGQALVHLVVEKIYADCKGDQGRAEDEMDRVYRDLTGLE